MRSDLDRGNGRFRRYSAGPMRDPQGRFGVRNGRPLCRSRLREARAALKHDELEVMVERELLVGRRTAREQVGMLAAMRTKTTSGAS